MRTPRHADSGPVRITNRVLPCNCGCMGKDPWHATHFDRVVKNVEYFDAPTERKTKSYGTAVVVAAGTIKLPRGETKVVFAVNSLTNGTWYPLGWCIVAD